MLTDQERAQIAEARENLRTSETCEIDAERLLAIIDRLSQTGVMMGKREALARWFFNHQATNAGLKFEEEPDETNAAFELADIFLASGIIARVPSKAEITAAIMALIQPTERKIEQSERPSIAQLEAILNSEDPPKVSIKPDGSVVEIVPASTTVGHVADAVLDLLKPKAQP